jgi:C1A family cysteine protease
MAYADNIAILRANFHINIDIDKAISDLKQNPNYELLNEITGHEGGHSMAIVGYDDEKKIFIIRNSWSDRWGDKGYFYIDYEYFINRDSIFGFFIGDMFAIGKLN